MPIKDPEKKRAADAAYYQANAAMIRQRSAAYYASTREKGKVDRRRYRKGNLEQLRQYDAARYAADPKPWKLRAALRKARKRGAEGSYTAADVRRIEKQQKGRCAYCRTKLDSGRHIDHILPLSKGGSNWPANIQLLCAPCNLSKQAADPLDYARRTGRLL